MAVISPVVVAAGLAGASLAGAGPALAAGAAASPSPSPCPTQGLLGGVTGTLCQTVKSLPSPSSVLPSPVASVIGSVGSAVGSAVGSVTGAVTGSGSSGAGTAGTTGATGAGQAGRGSAARGHARAGGSQHTQGTVSALGATVGNPNLGLLSSLGVPGWLVRDGLGPLPSGTVPLSFPVVHPAARAAAQAAVKPTPRAVSSLWLIFAIGAACLVGLAGGLGRFEGRRGTRGNPADLASSRSASR